MHREVYKLSTSFVLINEHFKCAALLNAVLMNNKIIKLYNNSRFTEKDVFKSAVFA